MKHKRLRQYIREHPGCTSEQICAGLGMNRYEYRKQMAELLTLDVCIPSRVWVINTLTKVYEPEHHWHLREVV